MSTNVDLDKNLNKTKGIRNLVRYFEVVFKFKDIISFNSKISSDSTKEKSLSSSKMLILFFEIILDYYYKDKKVPIDYSSIEPLKIKSSIIKKIYKVNDVGDDDDDELFMKLFDLSEYMFKTVKKVLERTNEGFTKWEMEVESFNLSFDSVIYPNIDLLFYIIFYSVFAKDLREQLHKELRLSDIEYKIIERCGGKIVRDNDRVCNTKYISNTVYVDLTESKFDFISDKTRSFLEKIYSPIRVGTQSVIKQDFSLKKSDGVKVLLNILQELRVFNNRRRSRQDSI